MKLEKQVTSLKLSKKLKELGVKQESLWMWVKYEFWKKPRVWQSDITSNVKVACLSGKREYECSAFTVAELGEKLPETLIKNGVQSPLITMPTFGDWFVFYEYKKHNEIAERIHTEFAKSEANAKAQMIIYLIENNLIQGGGNHEKE